MKVSKPEALRQCPKWILLAFFSYLGKVLMSWLTNRTPICILYCYKNIIMNNINTWFQVFCHLSHSFMWLDVWSLLSHSFKFSDWMLPVCRIITPFGEIICLERSYSSLTFHAEILQWTWNMELPNVRFWDDRMKRYLYLLHLKHKRFSQYCTFTTCVFLLHYNYYTVLYITHTSTCWYFKLSSVPSSTFTGIYRLQNLLLSSLFTDKWTMNSSVTKYTFWYLLTTNSSGDKFIYWYLQTMNFSVNEYSYWYLQTTNFFCYQVHLQIFAKYKFFCWKAGIYLHF